MFSDRWMTATRPTLAVALLVMLVMVLASWGVWAYTNADAANAHGSPARSDWGDRGFASPHHLRECDWSPNGRNATGIGYNRGSTRASSVVDRNGVGPGCGNKDTGIRVKHHQSCGYRIGACGRVHTH